MSMTREELMSSVDASTAEAIRKKVQCEALYVYQAAAYLKSYRSDLVQMKMYADEIRDMEPVDTDAIIEEMSLSGVSYDQERVQTSNIPDICYKIVAICERKIEQHNKRLNWLQERHMDKFSRVHLVERVVDSMPPQTKEVATLLFFEGATYEETGDRMGLAKSSINNERRKAIGFLAEYLRNRERDFLDSILD